MKRHFAIAAGLMAAGLISGCSSMQDYDDTHFAKGWDNPGVMATDEKLGFNVNHEIGITVPEGTKQLRAWLAMPSDMDTYQSVKDWKVVAPWPAKVVRDARGNNVLYFEADNPAPGKHTVTTSWTHHRQGVTSKTDASMTRPHTEKELAALSFYLQDEQEAKQDAEITAWAKAAVGNEKNPIKASKLLYAAVLEKIEYHVKDEKPDAQKSMNSTGTGNARKTFDTCTGNCTDFHSLYAAASRAVGVPCRAVYGSFFKSPLDGQDKDQSYHCWIEFHAPNIGWIPLDVAVADVYEASYKINDHNLPRVMLTTSEGFDGHDESQIWHHFGNLNARRVVWHWGRDLVMNPPQKEAPLLWLVSGHAEADGKKAAVTRKLTFKGVSGH